jgi:hypothetical protein
MALREYLPACRRMAGAIGGCFISRKEQLKVQKGIGPPARVCIEC